MQLRASVEHLREADLLPDAEEIVFVVEGEGDLVEGTVHLAEAVPVVPSSEDEGRNPRRLDGHRDV